MAQATVAIAGKDEVRRLMTLVTQAFRPDKYAGKRKKGRLKGALQMELRWDLEAEDKEAKIEVSTHDISDGGIGIWLRKKINVGEILYVRDCSDGKAHPWLKVRVSHCINALKGFLVGGKFEFDK